MIYSSTRCLAGALFGAGLCLSPALAAPDIELPQTLVWTAYDIGSTGYSQAVGIGSALKNNLGINLRVLPGKNDVSRLVPLREDRAGYSATGSESSYASEGMYLFGSREWGPQPITQLIMSVSDGTSAMVTARDAGIKTVADLKGRRVAWVKSAASLQNSIRGHLAFAGLTWDDVIKVEVPGYAASVQAVIDGQADAAYGTTNSAPFLKIEASPRGLRFLPLPHDDEAGWKRLLDVLPFFFPAIAKEGPTIPPEGMQMASAAYPVLATMPFTSADQNYNLTKAMVTFYDAYKDSAPGAYGWSIDRQRFTEGLLPFNEGPIRYYKEIDRWTPEAQAKQDENLARRKLLQETWAEFIKTAPEDAGEFQRAWMKLRYETLRSRDLPAIQDSWDVIS